MRITKITVHDVTRGDPHRRVKPRVYFFVNGETTMENLEKRYSRPYKEYLRLLPDVWDHLDVKAPEKLKVRWSQNAGCSCGCSPGFVINGWGGSREPQGDFRRYRMIFG